MLSRHWHSRVSFFWKLTKCHLFKVDVSNFDEIEEYRGWIIWLIFVPTKIELRNVESPIFTRDLRFFPRFHGRKRKRKGTATVFHLHIEIHTETFTWGKQWRLVLPYLPLLSKILGNLFAFLTPMSPELRLCSRVSNFPIKRMETRRIPRDSENI